MAADPKKSGGKSLPTEPVNSEQLDRETSSPGGSAASTGELEERAAEAEARAEGAERRVAGLEEEMAHLREQMALLMRQARSPQERPDAVVEDADPRQPGTPLFDEDRPHGVVYGDAEVAYEQDGHQFGRDRRYLRTLKHRGCGRPFNPRLVGLTKPRPGQTLADTLDGIRDQHDR